MRSEEELIDERLTLVGREIAGDDFRLTPTAKRYLVAVINRLPPVCPKCAGYVFDARRLGAVSCGECAA